MGFTNTEPPSQQSENTWFTPIEFIDKLGPFDLDPCTVSYRPFPTAKHHINHDKGECGLFYDWHGQVWLNPPYGKQISPFVDKFICYKKGVMLIFARMGSKEMQKIIKSGAYVYLLRKRIHFIAKDGLKKTNAGTDSCLVFYQEKYINKCKAFEGVLIGEIL